MRESKPILIQTLLEVFPVMLAFLVPVFFLPFTSEFFDFNKLTLITLTTAFMVVLWVIKMFKQSRVEVAKSPLNLPIAAFLIVFALATIFSLHKVSSIFGAQGRWFPSLFATLVFSAFYYTATANISSVNFVKKGVLGLLSGISVSSIVALFSYFGFRFGDASYLQIANFTTTGSSSAAALLASVGFILSVSTLLSKEKNLSKIIALVFATINFLTILLIGQTASWVALGIGLLVLAYLTKPINFVENKGVLIVLVNVLAVLIALLVVPVTRSVLVNASYPKELGINARESWLVVSSVIRDFPILGTGPSTFSINYTRYKPLLVNAGDYWNIRFDKPFSEAFGVVSGLGIVGIVAVLGLVFKLIKYIFDSRSLNDSEYSVNGLISAIMSLIIAFGFTYSTVTTGFVTVLLVALLVSYNKIEERVSTEKANLSLSAISKGSKMSLIGGSEKEIFQYIIALPLIGLVLVGMYYMSRQYLGEYYTRRAISSAQENNGAVTYQMQQRAIQAFPMRDSYHNSYASINIALANSLASKQDLSDEEKATVQNLVAQAIRSSRVTTEVLNPLNASNWETRAAIYRALLGVAEDANEWAVKSLNAAIQLDPTNPRLRLALGGVYYAQKEYLSAANMFSQSVSLKKDYANAHYNLSQALKQLQKYPEATRELELTKQLLAEGSDDYKKVATELEELSKMPNVAGASTPKPTVDQLEAKPAANNPTSPANTTQGASTQPVPQEPLVNEGAQKPINESAIKQ